MKTFTLPKFWVLLKDLQIIYRYLYSYEIKIIDFKKIEKIIENFKINYQQLLSIKNCTMNFHLIVCFKIIFFLIF
jgi:hypothetical protein